MVRKRWALSENFEQFVKFVAGLGVEDLLYHIETAPSNATYLSSFSVGELLETLSLYLERKLVASMRDATDFSLLADESEDEAGREQFSLYGKWDHGKAGNISEHFLGIMHVDKTDSAILTTAIQQFFTAKGISLEHVRFLAFDGTNSMSGERTGVQRRVRNIAPHALYMNCRCHKLALCMVHLLKEPQYQVLQDVDSTLLGLWKLFEYSPRKIAIFKNVQEVYGKSTLHLVKATTTRWLSHGAACQRLVNHFNQIVDCLDILYDERKEPEVFGLRHALLRKDVTAMIFLLGDVLKIVNNLSLFLQKENMNFNDIPFKVSSTISQLENLITLCEDRHAHQELLFSRIDDSFQTILERTSLERRLRQSAENRDIQYPTPEGFLREIGSPFIRALAEEITNAFNCSPVLCALGVLDPRNLPKGLADISDYGKAEMETLANFYGQAKTDVFQGHKTEAPAIIDSSVALTTEFEAFKPHMFVQRQQMIQNDIRPSTGSLYTRMAQDEVISQVYSRVFRLLHLAMIIPSSTASVERI